MSTGAPGPRVGVYGYFGMGNVGNEGSLTAFLADLRLRRPDVTVRGFVAGPEQVRAEHGIEAQQLMWHRGDPAAPARRETARKLLGRLVDLPRTVRMVRRVDVLVVPGTGVLETRLMDRPWGLPYWLFVATLACRVLGRPVALVGVGAEPARHRLTRLLFTGIVRLATWVSVRDEHSREVVRSWGRRGPVTVVPDLAFALPVPDRVPVVRGHVVVGVMAYEGAPGAPDRGPDVVRGYAARMSEAVGRLVAEGRTVSLVVGDLADLPLAEDIRDTAARGLPGATGRVTVCRAATLEDLMAEMARAEVAVVSRFHNLVCALLAGTPVVSLSYADKSARLLEQVGLARFVQPMEDFDVDRLLDDLDLARAARPALDVVMKEVLGRYADDLADQLRRLSDQVLGPPGGARGGRSG